MARILRVKCKKGSEQTLVCKLKDRDHAFVKVVHEGDDKSLVDATGVKEAHWKDGMPFLSKTCSGHSKMLVCSPDSADNIIAKAVKMVEGTDPL